MRRKIYAALLTMAMLLSLSTAVLAAEGETDVAPALLLQTEHLKEETVVHIFLQGCEGVTNGRFTVSYDTKTLIYTGATVSDVYGLSSINDHIAGTLAFAWVGSQLTQENVLMLSIHFRRVDEVFVETTLNAQSDGIYAGEEPVTVAGASMTVSADTSALEQAIAQAEGLNKSHYTQQSFAAVETALTAAKAVLENPEATQAEMDAAAKALGDAMQALELLDENPPTFGGGTLVLTACLAAASAAGITVLLTRSKRRNHA